MVCPKCRAALDEHELQPELAVHACSRCDGAWYDAWNLTAEPGPGDWRPTSWRCPRCLESLSSCVIAGAKIERCPRCRGVWLDGSTTALRTISGRDDVLRPGRPTEAQAALAKPATTPGKPASGLPGWLAANSSSLRVSLALGLLGGIVPTLLFVLVAGGFGAIEGKHMSDASMLRGFAFFLLWIGLPIFLLSYVAQRALARNRAK